MSTNNDVDNDSGAALSGVDNTGASIDTTSAAAGANSAAGVVPGIDLSTLPAGARVERYGDNVVVRSPNGKFLPGTVGQARFTPDNARLAVARRKEKTSALLRQKISLATFGGTDIHHPADAIAAVGAAIYKDVAANPDANPRYRLEVWQAIGRHAGLLGDSRENTSSDGVTVSIGADLARDLVSKLLASKD